MGRSHLYRLQFDRGKPDKKTDQINKEVSGSNKMKVKPSHVLELPIQTGW